jgi:hypothetical protein
MPWRGSFLVLFVWCPKSLQYVNDCLFLKIWENFCYYFIEYAFYAFTCTSPPSFIPMVCRFGLIVSQRSWMFCLYFLIFYLYLNVLIPLSYLEARIFCLWLDPIYWQDCQLRFFFLIWLIELFISKFFIWFFSVFLCLYWISLSYPALSSLFHSAIYLYSLGINSDIYLWSLYFHWSSL